MSAEGKVPEVRCFARVRDEADKRRGMWIMTRPSGYRGAFFHGDSCEITAPDYTLEQLSSPEIMLFPVVEITPSEALAELDKGWPEAKAELLRIFARHGIDAN